MKLDFVECKIWCVVNFVWMTSDVDPWHFVRNPDPQIRTNLLFSSVADKMPTKNNFFLKFQSYFAVLFEVTFTPVFKNKTSRSKKIPVVEINGFLTF